MTALPSSDRRYSTPVSRSFCTTVAASSGAMAVYSGRKSPSCFQWVKATIPVPAASASTMMEMRCVSESPEMSLFSWSMGSFRIRYIAVFMTSWYASTTLLRT